MEAKDLFYSINVRSNAGPETAHTIAHEAMAQVIEHLAQGDSACVYLARTLSGLTARIDPASYTAPVFIPPPS